MSGAPSHLVGGLLAESLVAWHVAGGVERGDDGGLIIRPPLGAGERVVIHGAGVLFSREFHKTPVHIPGEDD